MPLFIIEREFAEQLQESPENDARITQINEDVGVRWVYSFLRSDSKKTYCLYEAASADAIREAARRAGIPADVVVEVSQMHPPSSTETAV